MSASAFGCDPNPAAETLVIADRGQAVSLSGDRPAPICRILDQLHGNRRGVQLDVSRTGPPETLILARGNQLDGDYDCSAADQVESTSSSTLRDCRASRDDRLLCVMSLERVLQTVEARFDSLPPRERGTLVLRLHPAGDADEYAEDVAETVSAFVYTEHVWLLTKDPDLLVKCRETLGAREIFNVRFALEAGVGASDSDTAWDIGADLVLVPARTYTVIEDDASQTSLDDGGTAWGVYRADSPADLQDLMRYEGIRMAIGALAPALESRWNIPQPEPLDCLSFLEDNNLSGLFFDDGGQCPAL